MGLESPRVERAVGAIRTFIAEQVESLTVLDKYAVVDTVQHALEQETRLLDDHKDVIAHFAGYRPSREVDEDTRKVRDIIADEQEELHQRVVNRLTEAGLINF